MLEIGSSQWIELVMRGAGQLQIAMDESQAQLFSHHAKLLMQWNRKHNLTAIIDPTEVAVKHYLDAIAPAKYIPQRGSLLDIGTGGGFPGIPLKILRPLQPMTLIDGVRKKINFVKHVIRELALSSIEARQIRAESLAEDENPPRFTVIVCRALSGLKQVVQWADPLLEEGGSIVAYRGTDDPDQADSNMPALQWTFQKHHYGLSTHTYHLPVLGDPRSVTVAKKK